MELARKSLTYQYIIDYNYSVIKLSFIARVEIPGSVKTHNLIPARKRHFPLYVMKYSIPQQQSFYKHFLEENLTIFYTHR
jgi:hypothetical protein